jgi:hypothetical protein
MEDNKYLSRRYIQTSTVILLAFITAWTTDLGASALVSLVLGALGVYGTSSYVEKKLDKGIA